MPSAPVGAGVVAAGVVEALGRGAWAAVVGPAVGTGHKVAVDELVGAGQEARPPAALVGAKLVGARKGKFAEDGTARAIPGHNIPFAILGVFILWLGWFGFNPGSELAADNLVTGIALNTMLAAAAGGLATAAFVWIKTGKPDVAFIGNGVLAGLVAITGPCGTATPIMSIVIGAIGRASEVPLFDAAT